MARLSQGKRFERDFKRSLDAVGYALRIPDKCFAGQGGRLLSEPSEGDFWFFARSGHSYLVECKATRLPSLPFANIGERQLEALARFDAVGERAHGLLALNYYGPSLRAKNELYLVAIGDFIEWRRGCGRKSLPEGEAERIGTRCQRQKGGRWGLPLQENPECWKRAE